MRSGGGAGGSHRSNQVRGEQRPAESSAPMHPLPQSQNRRRRRRLETEADMNIFKAARKELSDVMADAMAIIAQKTRG